MVELRKLKKGDYFIRKELKEGSEVRASQVWVKGDYIPSEHKFSCYKWDDVNHESFLKGSKEVFVEFCF